MLIIDIICSTSFMTWECSGIALAKLPPHDWKVLWPVDSCIFNTSLRAGTATYLSNILHTFWSMWAVNIYFWLATEPSISCYEWGKLWLTPKQTLFDSNITCCGLVIFRTSKAFCRCNSQVLTMHRWWLGLIGSAVQTSDCLKVYRTS